MNRPSDVAGEWPSDPGNDELARIADQLQNAPPALSADAMARVEQRISAELGRLERHQRWQRVAFGFSMAAAILLSVGGYVVFRMNSDAGPARQPIVVQAPIEDRVTIVLGTSPHTPVDEKPLVRLDEYRSLFAD